MVAKYKIGQIAKWFLTKEDMTQKRLQKLCYYAQAWFYTLKNVVLVENDFEAWVHGPVSAELRKKLRPTGMSEIGPEKFNDFSNVEDVDDIELLEMVWNTYGSLGANSLEALTHTEKPWIKARSDCKSNEICTNVITLESMKEYYSSISVVDYGE